MPPRSAVKCSSVLSQHLDGVVEMAEMGQELDGGTELLLPATVADALLAVGTNLREL
jgi:hypothetical protein